MPKDDLHKNLGENIGKLVDEKNKAYGHSFEKCSDFLKTLYPNGVPVDSYSDMLFTVRIFDKLMRIASHKNAFCEEPYKDIAGYAILAMGVEETKKEKG
jgi:hypothetical protein